MRIDALQPALYDLDLEVPAVFSAEEVRYGIHLARIAHLRKALRGEEPWPTCDAAIERLYRAGFKLGAPPRAGWADAVRRDLTSRRPA